MRFTVRLLGAEVLHVDTDREEQQTGGGDATSMPIGFTSSPGDQRWEPGQQVSFPDARESK